MKKKIIYGILAVVLVWGIVFAADFVTVSGLERRPVFCVQTKGSHYVGLGYAYDAYPHPINGRWEYALTVFGDMVICTFTN